MLFCVLFLLLDFFSASERDSLNAFQVSKIHNLNHFQPQLLVCFSLAHCSHIPIFYEKSNPQASSQTRKLEESYGSISFNEHSLQTSNPSESPVQLSQREKKVHLSLQLLFNLTLLPLRLCPKCSHLWQLFLSGEVTALRVRRCFTRNLSRQKHIQQWACGCQRKNQGTLPCLVLCHTQTVSCTIFPRISLSQGV